MKSNAKSLKENKFNFLNFLKPCLIASLIIVLLAGLFWGIWGFNKGFDFTGGTQLVVEFQSTSHAQEIETEDGLNNISNQIKEILDNNGADVNSLQVQGEYSARTIVVTFKNVSKEKLQNIRIQINNKFNNSDHYLNLDSDEKVLIFEDEELKNYDITKQTSFIESFISKNTVLTTIACLVFALIIAMIYGLIRFKTASSLAMVFVGILDVVLTASLVMLARIEINTYFFGVLALTLIASVYMSADFLFNIKQKTKDPMLTDKTNHELAEAVVNENLTKTIIIGAAALVIALVVGIVGVLNVLHVALASFVAVAVVVASHLFVLPAFWAAINKKRELVKPAVVVNNNDAEAEVVEIEENNEDENAEVKEVSEEA